MQAACGIVQYCVVLIEPPRILLLVTDRRTMTKVTKNAKNTSFCFDFDHQRLPDIARNNKEHHETFCSYLRAEINVQKNTAESINDVIVVM